MKTPEIPHAPCARDVINARRRRNGMIQAGLLPIVGVSVCWLAASNGPGEIIIFILLGFTFLSAVLDRGDVCPQCQNRITMLPSEGHFQLPRLSHKIRMCPYCGADFSTGSDLKSEAEQP